MATLFRLPPFLRHSTFLQATVFYPSTPLRFFLSTSSSSTSTVPPRTYASALSLLSSLQSNTSIRSTFSNSTTDDLNLIAIPEMLELTRRAGYEPDDFAKAGLRCIHVAGTKGKGSVCALAEGLLLAYNQGDAVQIKEGEVAREGHRQRGIGNIGTYTSPHLLTVRERIRINGIPISESLFTCYFFELWDRFSLTTPTSTSDNSPKPAYFRYLTLLALHTFLRTKTPTAIIECGIGGEFDSTNILPSSAVTATGITTLGIDHVGMLGDSIESIAWHKAGIMKPGTPAFTMSQVEEARAVLQKRAGKKGAQLRIVPPLPVLQSKWLKERLESAGPFQVRNASLALVLACTHLSALGFPDVPSTETLLSPDTKLSSLPKWLQRGLMDANTLPGRHTVIVESPILEWYIDGAHTVDSIKATGRWFVQMVDRAARKAGTQGVDGASGKRRGVRTVLIFNQQDGGRDAGVLLKVLLDEMQAVSARPQDQSESVTKKNMNEQSARGGFDHAIFSRNEPFNGEDCTKRLDLENQKELARLYKSSHQNLEAVVVGSVQQAVELVRRIAGVSMVDNWKISGEESREKVMVLVTGSLHLVGGLLQVLEGMR